MDKSIEEKLKLAIEVLTFYANSHPTEKFPYNEFGCGCCSGFVKADPEYKDKPDDYHSKWDIDWENDENIQGYAARDVLKKINNEVNNG